MTESRLVGLEKVETNRLTGEAAVHNLLCTLGCNPASNEGMKETPARVYKALLEMTSGYQEDPAVILSTVFEEPCDEVVILKGIQLVSLCEHHMLPFTGSADVGYIPGRVVGLSKLARLVDCFARRFQIQERMTRQIALAIMEHLKAEGAAVVVRAVHSCMACRGVKKQGATMVTSSMLGSFRTDVAARMEFLHLCGS